jgi:hypothetical protein
MRQLLLGCFVLFMALGSAQAAGQFSQERSLGALVGLYGPGIGGIISYAQPFHIEGLARSGLGLVIEGQLGAGAGNDELSIAAMVGPKLVFVLNQDTDLYLGLGVGGELIPDAGIGAGGNLGVNFDLNGTSLFAEGGLHPGNHFYLGAGLRF